MLIIMIFIILYIQAFLYIGHCVVKTGPLVGGGSEGMRLVLGYTHSNLEFRKSSATGLSFAISVL